MQVLGAALGAAPSTHVVSECLRAEVLGLPLRPLGAGRPRHGAPEA